MLQLGADGQLGMVDDAVAIPAIRSPSHVRPPLISVLSITDKHLDNGRLQVDDILRTVQKQWAVPRSLRKLHGDGSEDLLRVMGPHLEELETSGEVQPSVMEEVLKLSGLRRLKVRCAEKVDFPDLPLLLEELIVFNITENQLRCVEHMPRLCSLAVINYLGPNLTFPPSKHNSLRWLGVCFDTHHKSSMLSLIRAHASSVQELRVFCTLSEGEGFYFPDFGQELADCGLHALQYLALDRKKTCQAAACMVQRRDIRSCLPPSVDVVCMKCQTMQF
ncbi:uncharacterized protein LOC113208481 [Frankliniella occidentalis]|uniref:Uncharacterized protein LOC113208481 n=1 Tax=Frankliniella occidentalis TaxID=133901 RepID=A0A9C6XU66_FRAOC|nr:uncharacterized protein LOC113208481 [Frankliniella occidentalis]